MKYSPPKNNPFRKMKPVHQLLKVISHKETGLVLSIIYSQDGTATRKYLLANTGGVFKDMQELAKALGVLSRNKLVKSTFCGGAKYSINELTRENVRLFLSEVII